MFTGIVEEQGTVKSMSDGEVPRLVVSKPDSWEFKIGASVAVDGVCLTVVEQTKDTFSADVVPETVSRSTMRDYKEGRAVNLERPLKVGDEMGGHMVQGHVDNRLKITKVEDLGISREITLDIPEKYLKFVVEKGSIAINGVSLTIARIEGQALTIALVPHTLEHTNLSDLAAGDEVNVEFDSSLRSVVPQ